MKHTMKLHHAPFYSIQSGEKTIELRLCDEKRSLLAVGDEIEFVHVTDADLILNCRVVALHKFPSFAELYESLPLLKCGYTEQNISTASPNDMDLYYSKAEQEKYGVLGIEITLQ